MKSKIDDKTRKEIRTAVLKGGMTHREAAATFGVSLRQVQKAVNPLKRIMQDRSYYERNRQRYLKWAEEAYERRKKRRIMDDIRQDIRKRYARTLSKLAEG